MTSSPLEVKEREAMGPRPEELADTPSYRVRQSAGNMSVRGVVDVEDRTRTMHVTGSAGSFPLLAVAALSCHLGTETGSL